MVFDTKVLRNRLAGSTERADSITSTAQWILFHKRHATEVAEQWAEAVISDKNKLAEIYIANEVIQQSKLKRKGEFVTAFGAVLPRSLSTAYFQSDIPTRDRITRVVKVWRDRSIFTPEDQQKIEDGLSTAGTTPSIPPDLIQLLANYTILLQATESGDSSRCEAAKNSVKSSLDELIQKVDQMVPARQDQGQEPEEEVEVYTAEDAQKSEFNDQDGEIEYAESDEEAPPEKKQKVDVDPKLASFLASLT